MNLLKCLKAFQFKLLSWAAFKLNLFEYGRMLLRKFWITWYIGPFFTYFGLSCQIIHGLIILPYALITSIRKKGSIFNHQLLLAAIRINGRISYSLNLYLGDRLTSQQTEIKICIIILIFSLISKSKENEFR